MNQTMYPLQKINPEKIKMNIKNVFFKPARRQNNSIEATFYPIMKFPSKNLLSKNVKIFIYKRTQLSKKGYLG